MFSGWLSVMRMCRSFSVSEIGERASLLITLLLPLCTADDLRAELEEIDDQLMNLGAGRVIDVERLEERRRILLSWRDRLSGAVGAP
jgi:hypothetical protein